ncbi:phosphatase 2C-like domain-containing protein [Gautieria morchelliformis]|nr:phosphatase 2C-like domain-containing protein [Gautieria morchelliformis]
MSSTTMSKRLCTVIPRQSRALSLYSVSHIDSVPPPQPYARPSPVASSRHPGGTSPNSSTTQNSQTQPSQPLTPSPPLQIALSPLPRSPQSSNSTTQAYLFPPTSFPSHFPYLSPSSILSPASKRSRLTYHLDSDAYGIPKRRAHTHVGTCASDLDLAVQVGEDSYFLRPDAMGVADGVGGWSRAAPATANSALFSRSLMHFCSYELSLLSPPPPPPSPAERPQPSTVDVNPIDILQRSYDKCISVFQRQGLTGGSATALLAVLRDEELRIAHLGDCAVCLVRDGGIVYRSEEMQHSFNYPLQLGPSSPTLPAHARAISLPVQQNDILILSSDGMTDNLWDEDVLDEINKFTASERFATPWIEDKWKKTLPSMLSQALCSRAKRVSETHALPSEVSGEVPFARRAREEGIKFVGGKCDDISVLVAVISPHAERPPATS